MATQSTLQHAEKSANVLKTISHPVRLNIIELLSQPNAKPTRVSDIVAAVEQPQAIVSQHLITLKDRGILTSTKQGTNIFYRPAIAGLAEVLKQVVVLIGQNK